MEILPSTLDSIFPQRLLSSRVIHDLATIINTSSRISFVAATTCTQPSRTHKIVAGAVFSLNMPIDACVLWRRMPSGMLTTASHACGGSAQGCCSRKPGCISKDRRPGICPRQVRSSTHVSRNMVTTRLLEVLSRENCKSTVVQTYYGMASQSSARFSWQP